MAIATRKEVVPFWYDYVPKEDLLIGNHKVLHRGVLIISKDNPLIGKYFFKDSMIPTDMGNYAIQGVLFDPDDNTMAVYIKGQFTIIDYEKCQPKEN